MYNFEILIKSFIRFDSLKRLIDGIIKYFPDVIVRIADDSIPDRDLNLKPHEQEILRKQLARRDDLLDFIDGYSNIHFYSLPFDTGLSAGRNFLVKKVQLPYFVIMDDDFIITKRTDLDRLYRVVTSKDNIILVSGGVDYGRHMMRIGEVTIGKDGQYHKVLYGKNAPRIKLSDVECIPCRLAPNFFIANIELFKRYNLWWEPDIKTYCEHALFFLRIPDSLEIYYTEECIVNHDNRGNRLYRRYRGRKEGMMNIVKRVTNRTVKQRITQTKYN